VLHHSAEGPRHDVPLNWMCVSIGCASSDHKETGEVSLRGGDNDKGCFRLAVNTCRAAGIL